MENQHKQIKNYRDLSPKEIELMNRIKEKEAETLALHQEIIDLRFNQQNEFGRQAAEHAKNKRLGTLCEPTVDNLKMDQLLESHRLLEIAKINLQQGFSWFVRAVALPDQ